MMDDHLYIRVPKLIFGFLLLFSILGVAHMVLNHPEEEAVTRIHTIHTYTVAGADLREEVACEFDEPLKYINLIMHAYDSNEEMYADFITLADEETVDKNEEIWGWSNCVWQPEDSWAACDVYYVKPAFVHADMNIDTVGHEVTHATCGGYHD